MAAMHASHASRGESSLARKASTRLQASFIQGLLMARTVLLRCRRRPLTIVPSVKTAELTTPALVVDAERLETNLRTMAEALPGDRLRPHVKAHKCTALAARQAAQGHTGFTCAPTREMEGVARAGLGQDLLLANEVADASRLGQLVQAGARVTLAVDSEATIEAAARAGVPEVLIDVNVGLPRCGCPPGEAGRLADRARAACLTVRCVMGYEGHIVGLEDRARRSAMLEESMGQLVLASGQL